MAYEAASERYSDMQYRVCGKSGLKLPALSLGLWHNFGDTTPISTQREILRTAFSAITSGADAVITGRGFDTVRMLANERIPVMGHLGFVPRKSTWVGSIRAVMNREYEATITSTGNDAHWPVPVGIRAGGNQRSH